MKSDDLVERHEFERGDVCGIGKEWTVATRCKECDELGAILVGHWHFAELVERHICDAEFLGKSPLGRLAIRFPGVHVTGDGRTPPSWVPPVFWDPLDE